MTFKDTVHHAARQALPDIQRAYDSWTSKRPGAGLCGTVARCLELSLSSQNIEHERIGEDGHFYVLALSSDGQAVAVDVPWSEYEIPHGDPTQMMVNWSKLPGVIFDVHSLDLTTIV